MGVGGERRRGSKVRRGSWAKGKGEERRAEIRAYRARTSKGLVGGVWLAPGEGREEGRGSLSPRHHSTLALTAASPTEAWGMSLKKCL